MRSLATPRAVFPDHPSRFGAARSVAGSRAAPTPSPPLRRHVPLAIECAVDAGRYRHDRHGVGRLHAAHAAAKDRRRVSHVGLLRYRLADFLMAWVWMY